MVVPDRRKASGSLLFVRLRADGDGPLRDELTRTDRRELGFSRFENEIKKGCFAGFYLFRVGREPRVEGRKTLTASFLRSVYSTVPLIFFFLYRIKFLIICVPLHTAYRGTGLHNGSPFPSLLCPPSFL